MKIGIIGSGPAGASAAHVLVKRGFEVVLIDVGNKLEPEIKEKIDAPTTDDEIIKTVKSLRQKESKKSKELPEKLLFGSTFVYKQTRLSEIFLDAKSKLLSSFAYGGLSNVWGANVCAVANQDMSNWPFSSEALIPAYKALNEFVEISSRRDVIDELYDIKIGNGSKYPLGKAGNNILNTIDSNVEALKSSGIYGGRAKIACGNMYTLGNSGCVSCGLCMHGCVYKAIFNSAYVIDRLMVNPLFTYQPGFEALSFVESEDRVKVVARNVFDDSEKIFQFDRLMIGAGVVGSTALVARSLNWTDHEFEILDSQKYYFPFFTFKGNPGALTEKQNNLAQIFVQLVNLKNSKNIVHIQLYPFNDIVLESLRHTFGWVADVGLKIVKPIFERLMIGMVYFHSNDSGVLKVKIKKNIEEGLAEIKGIQSKKSRILSREVFGKLLIASRKIGGFPLHLFAKEGPPGRSQHFGGTLPMAKEPKIYQTDILGRPFGCKKIHVVDASVLPSIPGTPTTYTMMANAVRIAQDMKS